MTNFTDFLVEAYLTEGGKAIKGTASVTQIQARNLIPGLLKHVSSTLGLKSTHVKLIGSAGKKPTDDDLSGDIDLAVQVSPDSVEKALVDLAYDKKSHRSFKGLNVYSFAHPVEDQIVQVDLMPVNNIDYAAWSFQAHENDLKQGYKGAHRNEVMFAVAKHATPKNPNERYFYDLSRGLMVGKQSTIKGKKGQDLKGKKTTDKRVLTDDPDEVTAILFGKHIRAAHLNHFDGVWKALTNSKFPYADKQSEIFKQIKTGIVGKKLKLPEVLA